MVRATVPLGRITMTRQNDGCLEPISASDGGVEIVDFKPQEHAVAGNELWITDGAVMMRQIPPMQLQDQPVMRNQPLIVGSAMRALTTKELLIPTTGRLNIFRTNQWLWTHKANVTRSFLPAKEITSSHPIRNSHISEHRVLLRQVRGTSVCVTRFPQFLLQTG